MAVAAPAAPSSVLERKNKDTCRDKPRMPTPAAPSRLPRTMSRRSGKTSASPPAGNATSNSAGVPRGAEEPHNRFVHAAAAIGLRGEMKSNDDSAGASGDTYNGVSQKEPRNPPQVARPGVCFGI